MKSGRFIRGHDTPLDFLKSIKDDAGASRLDAVMVLARNNDPYSIGAPATQRDAEWFAELLNTLNRSRTHLRGVHYVAASREIALPDGRTYLNSDECWTYLTNAARYARILGLVDPLMFNDQRNDEARVFAGDDSLESPSWDFDRNDWQMPGIKVPSNPPVFNAGTAGAFGYDAAPQPYRVEIWIEKSTMNHLLLPLCEEYGATLCVSSGFQSITSARLLLERAERRTHVLYISDFDPAGEKMAPAVARQVQFATEWAGAVSAPVTIESLMLTAEQVEQYELPPIPIKNGDKRKQGFEARHGGGAVELDALEALHPGVFESIVEDALQRYQDSTLEQQLYEVGEAAGELVRETYWEAVQDLCLEGRAIYRECWNDYDRTLYEIKRLAKGLDKRLAPLNKRLAALQEEYVTRLEALSIDLPPLPEGEPDGPICDDPLLDTRRPHMAQLAAYRRHGGGA